MLHGGTGTRTGWTNSAVSGEGAPPSAHVAKRTPGRVIEVADDHAANGEDQKQGGETQHNSNDATAHDAILFVIAADSLVSKIGDEHRDSTPPKHDVLVPGRRIVETVETVVAR